MYPELLTPQEIEKAKRIIAECNSVVITAHRAPDGDALGSSLALSEYLTALGKDVRIILPNPFPDFLRNTPRSHLVSFYDGHEAEAEEHLGNADLVCLLDSGELSRLGRMGMAIAKRKKRILCIDHHLNPDTSMPDLLVSRPEASSTCELIFLFLHALGGLDLITTSGATAIYIGMMTDTGAFTYNSSVPYIYNIIGALLEKGIDKDKIYRDVYHTFTASRLRFTGYVLSRKLRFYRRCHASIMTITREEMERFHFIRGDAEGLVNQPLQVRGMRLSISLREDTERDAIRVSLRSVDDFPCNEMAARFFNGGGHLNASGGELPYPIEEALKTAEAAIEAYADKL